MSTSTLGGFEREERKILYDEYLFQRRVLFGITISIIFAAFIWTIAICTDHWILVAGEKRMYSLFHYVINCDLDIRQGMELIHIY